MMRPLARAALAIAALAGAPALAGDPVAEPAGYRMEPYRAPVPETLAGARVVDTCGAAALWRAKAALFIDVLAQPPRPAALPAETLWRPPVHKSVPGAVWLANVGYGTLSPETEASFRRQLERLTGGDRDRDLVFFCLDACWMSWNAAKRAVGWGYRGVIWFREGVDGWREAGLPLAEIEPAR